MMDVDNVRSMDLVPRSNSEFSREQVDLIKSMVAVGATDDELSLFLYRAKITGLDPLSRQIYFIKRKKKNEDGEYESSGTIQVGIDGFRIIADRTGKLKGIKRGTMVDERGILRGWAEVYRKDWDEPAREEVSFEEYAQKDYQSQKPIGLWKSMPETMIKKCAEAAALRMAFPADLSGIYSYEEMAQAGNEPYISATPPSKEKSTPKYTSNVSHPNFDNQNNKDKVAKPAKAVNKTTETAKIIEVEPIVENPQMIEAMNEVRGLAAVMMKDHGFKAKDLTEMAQTAIKKEKPDTLEEASFLISIMGGVADGSIEWPFHDESTEKKETCSKAS